MSDGPGSTDELDPRARLARDAPWLLDEALGVCVVGSAALAEACRRSNIEPPRTADVDFAWALDVSDGERLLEEHGALLPVTDNSRARGTLALRVGGRRHEVTSFRGAGETVRERIASDLARRDMTIGAIAWHLDSDELIDPEGGLEDWRARRIEPVGDPNDRIAEHPVRWLRYYRKAHELGFELSSRIRKAGFGPSQAASIPREQVAQELRRGLLTIASPGRWLLELAEDGGLQHLAPELAAQFDGRAAGPGRHHPEVSQALHMILALEWAGSRSAKLPEEDRAALMVAVLCHDLGKSVTPRDQLPAHRGHERSGLALVRRLLDSLPGLADPGARRLAEQVCALHLEARRLREMRPGTLARLYDDHFRPKAFRADLFALAVGADSGGRLDLAGSGDRVAEQVASDVEAIRAACESIDAGALRARTEDVDRFRSELHAARTRALRAAGFGG